MTDESLLLIGLIQRFVHSDLMPSVYKSMDCSQINVSYKNVSIILNINNNNKIIFY